MKLPVVLALSVLAMGFGLVAQPAQDARAAGETGEFVLTAKENEAISR